MKTAKNAAHQTVENQIVAISSLKNNMASKSNLTKPPQWWKHLREWKRVFWKKERQNAKSEIKDQKQ